MSSLLRESPILCSPAGRWTYDVYIVFDSTYGSQYEVNKFENVNVNDVNVYVYDAFTIWTLLPLIHCLTHKKSMIFIFHF